MLSFQEEGHRYYSPDSPDIKWTSVTSVVHKLIEPVCCYQIYSYICMMVGIYRITAPDGSVNIGQSWDIKDRESCYKGAWCKNQPKVYKSIKEYGWNQHQFDVLQELPEDISQDILDQLEIVFIQQYRECGFVMMNVRGGGSHGKHSEETKKKMSEKQKGNKYALGAIITDEAKQKRKDTIEEQKKLGTYKVPGIGRVLTEETKRKISESNKGKKLSKETIKKIVDKNTGRKQSQAEKDKRANKLRGGKRSEDSKKRMSDIQSKNPVISEDIITGKIVIHNNQRICAEYIGCNRVTVLRILNGQRKEIRAKENIIGNYKVYYVSSL